MANTPPDAKSVFGRALEIESAAARAAYLDGACGTDAGLRAEVEGLLTTFDRAGEFMRRPAAITVGVSAGCEPVSERPGTVIGPYKLMEQIGEGGMGLVFVAEQQEPVRRRVALKIIKPGMESRHVVARFEAERQALALMDHQNIAKVLDASTTPSGRPYFVMELVHGIPITNYCDANELTPRQRLELFIPVCLAIQHAHQKGIIHRDIKPSNVLVTMYDDKPVPKIIDFGVAKAIEQRLTEKTVYTQFGTLVGTFEYMSPEQAEMNAFGVDTRSDIYSLGVLLYELLTGTTPLGRPRLREAAFGEIVRLIKEEEAPRPSVRLSTSGALAKVAAARKSDPAKLTRLVRGELDLVVMKCLEKQRTRRYDSAGALARDVERYLKDEPIEARPPSPLYRFNKFARRHKVALGTVALVAAALVLGTAVSVGQALRATAAQGVALRNEQAAQGQKREADRAKDEAVRQRDELRNLNYVADMNLARHAWDENNLSRMGELLERYKHRPDETDLRGFEWHYLRRLQHRDLWSVRAHAGIVRSVAYLPDGKRLISAGRIRGQQGMSFPLDTPGEIKLWDAATGRELPLALKDVPKVIWSVTLSSDGKRLGAACGQDGIRVWDLATGEPVTLEPPRNEITLSVHFSPDGRQLVSKATTDTDNAFTNKHVMRTWDAAGRKPLLAIDKLPAGWYSPVFSPDGGYVAYTELQSGKVNVLDATSGQEAFSCTYEGGAMFQAVFSPDGKRLAGCGEKGIQFWNVETRKRVAAWPSESKVVWCLAFSRDGKQLAAGGPEGLIEVWDVKTGRKITKLKGHAGAIREIDFSPDGKHLASVGDDGTLRAWELSQPGEEASAVDRGSRKGWQVLSPDGRVGLKETGAANVLQLVDLRSGKTIGGPITQAEGLELQGWDAAGKTLVVPCRDSTVKIIDVATGDLVHEFKVEQHDLCVAALSPDGAWCAHSGPSGSITLRNVESGQPARAIRDMPEEIHNLAFSRDGRLLAAADVGGWVRVFDVATGRRLCETHLADMYIVGIRCSPDGRHIIAFGNLTPLITGEVRILDAEAGGTLRVLQGHALNVTDVDFSPDGRRIATSSADRTVRIWDLESGQEVLTLHGHEMAVCGARFVDGGRRLMSVSSDGDLRYWDATPLPD